MKVVLAIPFRDDAEYTRSPAFQVVRDQVSKLTDFWKVITVDSGHEPFNRAATRNMAVRQAEAAGADVVVLCDADSIPQRDPLRQAIIDASTDGLIHYPFNEVWEMVPKAIHLIRVGRNLNQLRNRAYNRYGPSQGGCWVVSPATWWSAGGQEERFSGWGCEDRAMIAAANTLVGRSVQHEGVLMCLYHHRPPIAHQWIPQDVQLLTRYESSIDDPEMMKEILNERAYDFGPVPRKAQVREEVGPGFPGDLYG